MKNPFKIVTRIFYIWKIKSASKTIGKIDVYMRKAGYDRNKRRQFWRSFVAKKEIRDMVQDSLLEGLK